MQWMVTYHLAVKGLRYELLEVLRLPLGRGLLGVQARRAHGCGSQHVKGGTFRVWTYRSAATWG